MPALATTFGLQLKFLPAIYPCPFGLLRFQVGEGLALEE
jgi:hypothetical protein